jgi:lambda family phage tail tape measure protein
MADNRTTVKITADASGYTAELDRARRSAEAFQQTQDQAARRVQVAQDAIAEATQSGSNASARAINNFVSQLARTADQAGKTRAELLQMKAAQLGIAGSVSTYIGKIEEASKHTEELGFKTSAARRELLVLAHEASQGSWKNFAGSLMVLGERINFMGLVLTPVGLALTATAAAAYLFAHQVYAGHEQAEAFNKAIASTGGYLGLSTEQLVAMSNGLAKTYAGLSAAREALAQVAATGAFTAGNLSLAAQAAIAMSSDIGIGTDKAAESLAKIQEDVIKWVTEYQRAHHTFSASQVEEIENFVKLGDTASATRAIMQDLANSHAAIEEDANKHMGAVERWWTDWASIVGRVKTAIMGIGIPDGITKQVGDQLSVVEAVQRNITDQRRMGNLAAARAAEQQLAVEQKKLDVLRDQQAAEFKAQRAREQSASGGDAKVAVSAYLQSDKYASPTQRHANDLQKENEAFRKATQDLDKSSADYAAALQRHNANISEIDTQYSKKVNQGAAAAQRDAINAAMVDQKNRIAQLESDRRDSLAKAKNDYDTGASDYREYYERVKTIDQDSYRQEIAAAQQRVELASGKKEKAAREEALAEVQKIQAKLQATDADYTRAMDKEQSKRTALVEKYRTQQRAHLQRNQDAYTAQDDTRFMLPQAKANYAAELRIREAYYQEVWALKEQYDSKKIDQDLYDQKLQVAADAFSAQETQLQEHLRNEQAIRDSYQDQIHLAVTNIASYGKTGAEYVGQAFTTAWGDISNALDSFVTTGKLNFSDFASSILADMAKIALHAAEMQIFQSVASSWGGFSTGGAVGHYADGGHISGPGTGTSDSIPAMLSNGEYVINAASTRKYRGLLESINSGHTAHFATGGPVGAGGGGGSGSGGGISITVNHGQGGGLSDQDAKDMHALVQAFVDQRMTQRMRGQGGFAYQMKYGQI